MKALLVNDKDIVLTDLHEALSDGDSLIKIDKKFIQDSHMYLFFFAINNGKFEECIDNDKIKIPESIFEDKNVTIKVRVVKRTDKSSRLFVSAPIQINHYISLGPRIDEMFPRVIAKLMRSSDWCEREIKILKNKGDLF